MKQISWVAMLGVAVGPAFAQDMNTMTVTDLLAQAQIEGSVVVYSFTSRIARVEEAFEAAYPGIDMQGFDMSSTEQIARLKAEAQAGTVNADVVYISDAAVVLSDLLTAGIVETYVPPRVASRLDSGETTPLLAQRLSTKVLMYAEDAYPNAAPVDSLWDLTREEWQGRVVMVDPLQRGDYLDLMTEIVLQSDAMAAAYQQEFGTAIDLGGAANAGEKFIADLFANDLILVGSTDDVNSAIGRAGQDNPPIGFTTYSDRRDNADEGWALQVANDVAPAPGIVFPAIVALATGAKNPAAARLAIDFLMGDDTETGGPGFAPFYVPGDYATRNDIVQHPDAIPLDDFNAWSIDPAATAAIRADVGDLILTLQ